MRLARGLTTILAALLVLSCQYQEDTSTASINGTWESLGAGWVMEIADSTHYAFYDITNISCIPNYKGALSELRGSIGISNDTLALVKGVMTYKFIRTDSLPNLCKVEMAEDKAKDPLYNFEVLSATIHEHYAFMALNDLDWNALYNEQKHKLTQQSTDAELYLIVEETLEKLNDNHAFLEATDEVYAAVDAIQNEKEITDQIDNENLPSYGDFQVASMVAKHHMQENMTDDSWLVQWGKMTDDIGYIQVKAMWLHADLDIPPILIKAVGRVDAYVETFHKMYEGDYIKKEVQGINTTMDKVMADLSHMKSIIIDVRFNGGGQDAVSFEILNRFTPQRLQVATQQLKYGNQTTAASSLYIDGLTDAYQHPIYILTSTQTGSAAESFALASMTMNNAHRIGSPTSGAMSTALEKNTP